MPDDDDHAPDSDEKVPASAGEDAEDETDGDEDDDSPEPDVPVAGDDASAPPLDPAIVLRFVGSKRALDICASAIRRMVPPGAVEELAADAVTRALTAKPPRLEAVLPGWLATIARRRAMRWLDKRRRRAKYEGAMPLQVAREDDYTGASHDAVEPGEFAYDADADEEPGDLLGNYLDRLIGEDEEDRKTHQMIREHAESKQSYRAMAKERGMTEAQIANRIYRFKQKYAPRVKKRQRTVFWMWIAAGAALVVAGAAVIAWVLMMRAPEPQGIAPDPAARPLPSATASGFPQALPTPEPSTSAVPVEPPPDDPRFNAKPR